MKRVFIYWNSGFNNAPHLVQQCLKSWQYHNKNYDIVELDDSNLLEWIDIDQLIKDKKITNISKSDIIRIFLLKKYGGIWVDATLFCVKPLDEWLTDYIDHGFFAFSFEPRCDRMISSWFLYGEKDNYIIDKWYRHVIDYIKNAYRIGIEHTAISTIHDWNHGDKYNNHYFWFHYIFGDLYNSDQQFKKVWNDTKKISNVYPQLITQKFGFNKKTDDEFIKKYNKISPVYKLTYRYDFNKCNKYSILHFLYNTISGNHKIMIYNK